MSDRKCMHCGGKQCVIKQAGDWICIPCLEAERGTLARKVKRCEDLLDSNKATWHDMNTLRAALVAALTGSI